MATITSLSDRSRAIILGSLLGDGSLRLQRGYRNARFSFRHSATQREYFWWKVHALEEISSPNGVHAQHDESFGKRSEKLHYQSRAIAPLTELYQLTHAHGRIHIRRKWLNMMTPLSLAVWWFDDGSIIGNARKGVLCTDGFSEAAVKQLARYLQVVWGIASHVGAVGRKREGRHERYYRLWLGTEELKKFLRIILPYTLVASMLPKVIVLYRDSELQQRWISEVHRQTSFSHEVIQRYLDEKRAKWQRFRE